MYINDISATALWEIFILIDKENKDPIITANWIQLSRSFF